MSCELVIIDCFGREVVLEHSNWVNHEQRRPEVVAYHDALPLVLHEPDRVIEASRDGQYHYFRLGIGSGRYAHLPLHLVVAEYVGVFKLVTWWFGSDRRLKGRTVYER